MFLLLFHREMAVKFNDYFEFPREFDISPYTAAGLAKLEGNACMGEERVRDEEREKQRHTCIEKKGDRESNKKDCDKENNVATWK